MNEVSAPELEALLKRARSIAARVRDPDVPVLTVDDIGVLREIRFVNGVLEVTIAPIYSGSPAMQLIALNIETALEDAGFGLPRIVTSSSPSWTTDWISESGKAKLKARGISYPPK